MPKHSLQGGDGFAVAELVLSLALIAIAALTLVALSFTSLASRQKAQDSTAAMLVAEEQLALTAHQIENLTPSEHDAFWDSTGTAPYVSGVVTMGGTDYSYEVTAAEVASGTVKPNRLRKLDVTVWWWSEEPGQSRRGSGQLQYSASRLVREIENEEP